MWRLWWDMAKTRERRHKIIRKRKKKVKKNSDWHLFETSNNALGALLQDFGSDFVLKHASHGGHAFQQLHGIRSLLF